MTFGLKIEWKFEREKVTQFVAKNVFLQPWTPKNKHFPLSVVQNHTVHVFWSIVVSGTIFVDFWVILEPKSDQNSLKNVLGVRFGPRRLPRRPFWTHLGPRGSPKAPLGTLSDPRRLPTVPFRSLWDSLGAALGLLWSPLGSLWTALGGPWATLGITFGALGPQNSSPKW